MVIKYNTRKLLRSLLLVNGLALMLLNVLPSYFGALRFGVLIFAVLFSFSKSFKNDRVIKWQIALLLYVFLSCLYTYYKYGTFDLVFGRLFISSLAWAWGAYLVKNQSDFLYLYKTLFMTFSFVVVFLLLSNIFNFGTTGGYSDGSEELKFGMSGVNIVKIIAAFIIIMLPLIFDESVRRLSCLSNKIIYFVFSIATGFILLGFKRGALLSVLVGTLVFIFFYKKKSAIILVSTFSVIFSIVFMSYFSDDFNQIKNARLAKTEESITGDTPDARMNEGMMTIETAISNGPLVLLFGNGMFSEKEYYNTRRMHHTDYFTLLHGGGIVGMILYFGIYFIVLVELRKSYRKTGFSYFNNALYSAGIALIIAMLLQGISGILHGIDIRMYSFVFLGAIYRLFKIGGIKDDFSVSKLK